MLLPFRPVRSALTLRPPGGGAPVRLVAAGGRWELPGSGPIDAEYDTGSLWALPGLADAHAHLAADDMTLGPGDPAAVRRRGLACLAGGVFLVLDKGWRDESVLSLSTEPFSTRPDLEAAGRMIAAPGGYYPGFAVEVEERSVGAVVQEAARRSAGWVKLVGDWPRRGVGPQANFTEAALEKAVRVAHASGARVAIHTMAPEVPSAAVRAGVDSVEHGLFLTQEDLAALGERGGAWVPTVLRVEDMIGRLGADSSGGRLLGEGLDRVGRLLAPAIEAGVRVLAGSDLAVPSPDVAREAIRLWEWGLSTRQATEAVSTEALAFTGRPTTFEVGGPADAVFFAADPHIDPAVLLQPALVVRRGRVLGR